MDRTAKNNNCVLSERTQINGEDIFEAFLLIIKKGFNMIRIGITGGAGSGKSTVCKLLRSKDLPVIDLDQLARQVVLPNTPGYTKIVQHFGPQIVLDNKQLDRSRLRKIILTHASEKQFLEQIIHPEVNRLMQDYFISLEQNGKPLAFAEVPLLYEADMPKAFNLCVVVFSTPDIQIQRIRYRDGVNFQEAQKLIQSQMPMDKKAALADYVITNNGSYDALVHEVQKFITFLSLDFKINFLDCVGT